MLNRFVLQFPDELCNLFFLFIYKNPFRHPSDTSDVTSKKFYQQSKQGLIASSSSSRNLIADGSAPHLFIRYSLPRTSAAKACQFGFGPG